jgi:hypothetical protein
LNAYRWIAREGTVSSFQGRDAAAKENPTRTRLLEDGKTMPKFLWHGCGILNRWVNQFCHIG